MPPAAASRATASGLNVAPPGASPPRQGEQGPCIQNAAVQTRSSPCASARNDQLYSERRAPFSSPQPLGVTPLNSGMVPSPAVVQAKCLYITNGIRERDPVKYLPTGRSRAGRSSYELSERK